MKTINLSSIHSSIMHNSLLNYVVSLFTLAELKAVMNAIVLPVLFTVLFMNIMMGLLWVLLVAIIYEKIQVHKVENKKVFYLTLKWFTAIMFLISLITIVII